MHMRKRIAVIPAYEPDENLIHVLQETRQNGMDTVIVDDGSGQEYREVFRQASLYGTVLTHPENRGKGCALKTGYDYIWKHMDVADATIVTLDADGQHTVQDALNVCRTAEAHPGELILGSRKIRAKTPLRSRIGNTVTRGVYHLAAGVHVYDTQTGLRAFDGYLLMQMLEIPGKWYEYEMNVLLYCPGKHIPIREVMIDTIYLNGNSASHFHPLRDSFRIYRQIVKFSLQSVTGRFPFPEIEARLKQFRDLADSFILSEAKQS